MGNKPGGGLPPSGFGPALRRNREARGWTQRQLGEAAGLHPNTVAKLERGEVEPSWQVVLALATSLGVDCTAFTGGSPGPAAGDAEPADSGEDASPARKVRPAAKKPAPKRKGKK